MPRIGQIGPAGVDTKIATHAEDVDAHHAKTTSFTDMTDRAGKGKLHWTADKLLKGAGDDADPSEIDTPGAAYTEGARVYHSTTQEIANIDLATLAFDSERYDTDTIHDTTTNNSRLTCKTAGKYIISAAIGFFHNATGVRRVEIYHSSGVILGKQDVHSLSDMDHYCTVTAIWDLAVNEYVEVRVYQSSGGALNVLKSSHYSAEFMMQRIG